VHAPEKAADRADRATGDGQVPELRRREGLTPTQCHGWRNQLMALAAKMFSSDQGRPSAEEQRLEADLRRAKDVIAETPAENPELLAVV